MAGHGASHAACCARRRNRNSFRRTSWKSLSSDSKAPDSKPDPTSTGFFSSSACRFTRARLSVRAGASWQGLLHHRCATQERLEGDLAKLNLLRRRRVTNDYEEKALKPANHTRTPSLDSGGAAAPTFVS